MTNIKPEELHSALLKLLTNFHAFCGEHDLQYYMLGGTALGAKRHKGFIPWDDDVDVGMPRPDYNRLIELANQLPNNIEFKSHVNSLSFPAHYGKIIDSTTTLIEKSRTHYVEGLYIDVFPLDGAILNGDKKEIKRRKNIYWIERKILRHCSNEKPHSIVSFIFNAYCKLSNLSLMHKRIDKLLSKVDYYSGDCAANLFGAYTEKECVLKSVFGKPTLYEFENHLFFGAEHLDEYLRCLYDDYNVFPPKEKQVFKHSYYLLDLHMPYREFVKNSVDKEYHVY